MKALLYILMGLCFCALPAVTHARQTPLTVDQAVEMALARPEVAALAHAEVSAWSARAEQRSLWNNPTLQLGWEQILSPESESEGVVAIGQRFDVSGKRALRQEAAEKRAEAAEITGQSRELLISYEVKRRFYQALHSQRRYQALVARRDRLVTTLEKVALRAEAGDASHYEQRRVEREVRLAKAEIDTADAERHASWLRLTALIGANDHSGWPRVTGTLLPDAPDADPDTRPLEAERLDALATASRLEADAADRQWIPELGVRAGYRFVNGDETLHGVVAGISLTLPFWDYGQAQARTAREVSNADTARSDLFAQELAGELTARRTRFEKLRSAAQDFHDALDASSSLVDTAELSYEGGELELIDVMDAHNAAIDDQLRLLEMALVARMAQLDHELVAAGGSP